MFSDFVELRQLLSTTKKKLLNCLEGGAEHEAKTPHMAWMPSVGDESRSMDSVE